MFFGFFAFLFFSVWVFPLLFSTDQSHEPLSLKALSAIGTFISSFAQVRPTTLSLSSLDRTTDVAAVAVLVLRCPTHPVWSVSWAGGQGEVGRRGGDSRGGGKIPLVSAERRAPPPPPTETSARDTPDNTSHRVSVCPSNDSRQVPQPTGASKHPIFSPSHEWAECDFAFEFSSLLSEATISDV